MTDDGREEYSNERGVKVDSFGFFFGFIPSCESK